MKYCGECIGDSFLARDIIPHVSTENGDCPVCGSMSQHLFEPKVLQDRFELLCGIYVNDPSGRTLIEWLKEDWDMFNHPRINLLQAKEILTEILDDGEIVRRLFVPSSPSAATVATNWDDLRRELMESNRYFPSTNINFTRLEELLSYLIVHPTEIPAKWYRARIQEGAAVYTGAQMGAPPKEQASNGRANPAGIPYLYLASDVATAISEVRPHPGEIVIVAEFTTASILKLVDLRHPRKTVSPFMMTDENEILSLRVDVDLLDLLGIELTMPVIPKTAAIRYVPSQYLCEFIKKAGYDGVMYRSSVGSGINVAIFSPGHFVVGSLSAHAVSRVDISSNPV